MKRICAFMFASLLVVCSCPIAAAEEVVKVHYVPALYAAPLFVANDKGFFKELGIRLELQTTKAITESVPFLSAGQIDVVTGGYGAGIFSAIQAGLDIRITAPMSMMPDVKVPLEKCTTPLMVRRNAGIGSLKDLKGKKVGVSGGLVGGSGYLLIQMLERQGLSANDLSIVNLPQPDAVVALAQGAIDATVPSEPFATKMMSEGIGTPIDCPDPGTTVTGLLFSGSFMKQRPQVAKNFMVALAKGFRAIQGRDFFDQKNLQIFEKYTRVTPSVLRGMNIGLWDPNLKIDVHTLLDVQRVFMKYGFLKYQTPLVPAQLVDETYVKYALSVAGKFTPAKERP